MKGNLSTPINKTAALVTSRSKDNFRTIDRCNKVRESDFPLPHLKYEEWVHEKHASAKTGKVSQGNLQRLMVRDRKILDITGLRVGRLTAIGLARKSKEHKHVWVCRCDCGRYVHRQRKALTKGNLYNDRCSECERLRIIARRKEIHAKKMIREAVREKIETREKQWDSSGS